MHSLSVTSKHINTKTNTNFCLPSLELCPHVDLHQHLTHSRTICRRTHTGQCCIIRPSVSGAASRTHVTIPFVLTAHTKHFIQRARIYSISSLFPTRTHTSLLHSLTRMLLLNSLTPILIHSQTRSPWMLFAQPRANHLSPTLQGCSHSQPSSRQC